MHVERTISPYRTYHNRFSFRHRSESNIIICPQAIESQENYHTNTDSTNYTSSALSTKIPSPATEWFCIKLLYISILWSRLYLFNLRVFPEGNTKHNIFEQNNFLLMHPFKRINPDITNKI